MTDDGPDDIPLVEKLATEHAELLPCTAHLTELAAARSSETGAALDRCWPVLSGALDAPIETEDHVLFRTLALGDEGVTALFREEHRDLPAPRSALDAARQDGGDIERFSAPALRVADLLGAHMAREDAMPFPPHGMRYAETCESGRHPIRKPEADAVPDGGRVRVEAGADE